MKGSAISRWLVAGSLVVTVAALSATAAFAATPTVTPVASGLDNPRGLAFGPGREPLRRRSGARRDGMRLRRAGRRCLLRVHEPDLADQQRRLAHADRQRSHLVGIARRLGGDRRRRYRLQGRRCPRDHHRLAGPIPPTGISADTVDKAKHQLGHLIKAELNEPGDWDNIADVGHFDFQWPLEQQNLVPGQFPDANPYGVAVGPTATWVVDAGRTPSTGSTARATSSSPRSCRTRPRVTRCRRASRSVAKVRSTSAT